MARKRIEWIESLRVIAAIWVFVVHYIDYYHPEYFMYWNPGQLLCGLSGKLAMAMFLVVSGYLTASQKIRGLALIPYLIKRYLKLCIPLLVVTIVVALERIIAHGASVADMAQKVFSTSFLFEMTELCTQAWCLQDFLLAGVIIAVVSGTRFAPMLLLAAGLVLYKLHEVWIAIAVLGAFVYHVNRLFDRLPSSWNRVIFSPVTKAAVLIVSIVAIRRPERFLTYVIDGVACAAVFMVVLRSPHAQKFLSNSLLTKLGKMTFEFFLVHVFLFPLPTGVVEGLLGNVLPQGVRFFISMTLTAAVAFAAAYGLKKLLGIKALTWPFERLNQWKNNIQKRTGR